MLQTALNPEQRLPVLNLSLILPEPLSLPLYLSEFTPPIAPSDPPNLQTITETSETHNHPVPDSSN